MLKGKWIVPRSRGWQKELTRSCFFASTWKLSLSVLTPLGPFHLLVFAATLRGYFDLLCKKQGPGGFSQLIPAVWFLGTRWNTGCSVAAVKQAEVCPRPMHGLAWLVPFLSEKCRKPTGSPAQIFQKGWTAKSILNELTLMSVPLFSWIYISQNNLNRLTPVSLALYPEYHRIKEILFCKISGKDTDSSHKAQVSAQASVYWKELAVLLRLLVGAYLPSQCLKAEQTTFHYAIPQAGVKGNSGITEKHHCFCSNDLEKHIAAGKKCNLVQWKWSPPPLPWHWGRASPGQRGREGVQHWVLCWGWHLWACLHLLLTRFGCFRSATTLPCADGTAAGDSACMNARVTLQAGGISAARSPAVILPLEPKQHQAPEHLAYRLLEFCLNTWFGRQFAKPWRAASPWHSARRAMLASGEWALLQCSKSCKDCQGWGWVGYTVGTLCEIFLMPYVNNHIFTKCCH